MTQVVAVVDYGMGNLDSVARALDECGGRPLVTSDPRDLERAAAVVLPGVGAFPAGMRNLRERGLDVALTEHVVEREVPLLGLCLGMQLLADSGTEVEETAGLGFVPGRVERLEPAAGLRVPHVGWNDVHAERHSALFAELEDGRDFYFVHSYHFVCATPEDVLAHTPYGDELVAAVGRGCVYGVQFHPEKSQRAGFQLLRNFLGLARVADEPVQRPLPARR
jgi:glutamine amidotransferase